MALVCNGYRPEREREREERRGEEREVNNKSSQLKLVKSIFLIGFKILYIPENLAADLVSPLTIECEGMSRNRINQLQSKGKISLKK